MKIKSLILAVVLATSIFNFAAAKVISWSPYIDVKYKYYNVSGKSVAAIRNSISKKSTAKWGKRRYPSKTSISSKMRYKYFKRSTTCKLSKGRAFNTGTQYLPKLTGNVPAAVRKKFDAYVVKLKKHERAFLEFRVKAAKEVARYYKSKPSFRCSELDKGVNAATKKIYDKWDKKMFAHWRSHKHPTFK